jgi:hypothetical protein
MPAASGNRDLKEFRAQFGKFPADIRKQIRPELVKGGRPALSEAKRNASWSSRIPGATRLSVGFSKRTPGAALVVSHTRAPHAHAYENQGKPGTFRSPIFGNRENWATHTARPFLHKAAATWMDEFDADVGKVVDRVSRDMGFK